MVDAVMRGLVATETTIEDATTHPVATTITTMAMAGTEASTILDEAEEDGQDPLAMDETAGNRTAGGVPVPMDDLVTKPKSTFLGDTGRMFLTYRSSYKPTSIVILLLGSKVLSNPRDSPLTTCSSTPVYQRTRSSSDRQPKVSMQLSTSTCAHRVQERSLCKLSTGRPAAPTYDLISTST